MLQNYVTPNIGQKLSSNQWPIILGAGFYTTCRVERVLGVIRFNATFLPLRPYCEKIYATFSNDTESLTTYGRALWCRQIAYIRPCSLNNTTAFYFATECSERCSVCWRACACHNTFVLYLALTRVGLSVLLWIQCCTECYGLANS